RRGAARSHPGVGPRALNRSLAGSAPFADPQRELCAVAQAELAQPGSARTARPLGVAVAGVGVVQIVVAVVVDDVLLATLPPLLLVPATAGGMRLALPPARTPSAGRRAVNPRVTGGPRSMGRPRHRSVPDMSVRTSACSGQSLSALTTMPS